jgi:hypothetical protein
VVLSKRGVIVGSAVGAGLLLLIGVVGWSSSRLPAEAKKSWNKRAVTAKYVGSHLIELDKGHSSLTLSYDLENNTDLDYWLAESPGAMVMRRLKSNGSLSQEESMHLKYPVFLPARQSVRMEIEITKPFSWPEKEDPEVIDKLRDFVKQRLANAEGFVLFDEGSRCQVELPGAWETLQASVQSY